MTHLAQQLTKYYHREKTKLVFNKTYTLSQLSLEMYEKLGCQQVDPSVVSRVLTGKRLFTVKQLEVFCEILGIQGAKRTKLFQALLHDYLLKKGYDANLLLKNVIN
ncbi:MAG: hypothetical protein AAB553_00430 [Patescibacteria group bacterium]